MHPSHPHPRVDAHQHFWSDELVEALFWRSESPRIRRRGRDWILELPGEADYLVPADSESLSARSQLVQSDGVDRALIALSSPLGIEALPAEQSEPLLNAYHAGAKQLPTSFGAWGAISVAEPDSGTAALLLDEGFVGISLPAGAISTPGQIERFGEIFELLARRNAPLFVHPGPGPEHAIDSCHESVPPWWPSLTGYVSQMQAAWLAFTVFARPDHPELRAVFAMLAGGALFHAERLASRGIPTDLSDSNAFYETSSYGPRAVEFMADAVGAEQLIYGSDRPVAQPQTDQLNADLLLQIQSSNPATLFSKRPIGAT